AGMALAYRRYADDYIADEEAARAARLGLWAGQFDAPWEWRRSQQR
ncbi:MAG: thermonuclease family protein, partial [Alphaproteobacteria bacterium]|nr:thermonuclease family protein [Alphaproteobacteria bacterium]